MPQPTRHWYKATRRKTYEHFIFDLTEAKSEAADWVNEYAIAREAFSTRVLKNITVEPYNPELAKLRYVREAFGVKLYYEARF